MEQLRAGFALSWLLSTTVVCSHCRGGTVSWKHLGKYGDSHKVEIRYSFVWRRDFGTTICDDNAIGSLSRGYSNGAWDMPGVQSYSPDNETTVIMCTAYDAQENWAYGHNSFITTVKVSEPFHVRYGGGTWMSNVTYADGNCILKAGNIDFERRSDTEAVNNPPRALMMPIVNLIQGCQEDTIIRYNDDDNDNVRCRYAVEGATPDECAGACNGPQSKGYSHFHLNETTCVLHYDGGGATGLFAVAVVLEDHPSSTVRLGDTRTVSPSTYLSQTPLQFVVQIKHGNSCNERPTYPSQTIQNEEIITLSNCSGLNRTLLAYPGSQRTWITQFIVIGPQGMIAHPVTNRGQLLYSSYLVWAPESCPEGQHVVCYFAMDSEGMFGNQICFTVIVTASSNPCSVNNGGCSDICMPTELYRECSCYNPCWSLDVDLFTCIPDMDVACDGQSVTVSVTDCARNGTMTHDISAGISMNECQTSSSQIGNRVVLKWNVSSCDMAYWVNPVRILHAGHLWMWYSFDTNSSVITRGEYRKVPVTCPLPRTTEISATFVPELQFSNESFPIEVNLDGFGDLSFFFEFYNTADYTNAMSPADYPISITVSDRFYFAIGAIGRTGLIFFTQDCTAQTSSLDRDRPPLTYTFLRDGCFMDSTLRRHETPNPMEDRLSMEAFDFAEKLVAARKYATITLTCRVMICDAANATTRCQRGCVSQNRQKRSGDGRYQPGEDGDDLAARPQPKYPESSLQRITGTFIMIMERDCKDITSAAIDYSIFYWALIVIGIIMFGIIIFALILYMAYRVWSTGKGHPSARQEEEKESYYI